LGALFYVHATIVHPVGFSMQKVQTRRISVKKTLMALAASTLLLPATAVVAADQFSVTTASAAYKEDISYQNRNRQYREWRGKSLVARLARWRAVRLTRAATGRPGRSSVQPVALCSDVKSTRARVVAGNSIGD
jgi:hypothetical protein